MTWSLLILCAVIASVIMMATLFALVLISLIYWIYCKRFDWWWRGDLDEW